MNENIKKYLDTTQLPWGKLFYEIVQSQLSFVKNLKVLDFGSGFGITANALAVHNEVTAIEPNEEMIANSFHSNNYNQINGGLTELKQLPDNSFDVIVCHNVLEYATEVSMILNEFSRLLKVNGILSIVKHNHNGRIMQKIVYENKIDEGISILNGADSNSENFGKINYYSNDDITALQNDFIIDKILGIRTFFALQQNNEKKFDAIWKENMIKAEIAVCEIKEFINISFFNHLLIKKQTIN